MSYTEDIQVVCKSLKEITDALKKAKPLDRQAVKEEVESSLKEILRNHPGFTPQRKIQFPGGVTSKKEDILHSMPKDLQNLMDGMFFMSKVLRKKPNELKIWDSFARKAGDFKKALDSTTSGEGDEWVPTEFSPELFKLVRLELRVASLFPEIVMPSNPYELPVQLGRFTTEKHAEQTADTGQTVIPKLTTTGITGKTTFTAVGHGGIVLVSDEATEDSMVPMLPFIQQEIATGLAEGREDFIVNGDTAGTHEDSDITGASDRRKVALGLRALAHDNSYTQDLATLSIGNLRKMRKNMGKYGVAPSQLAWVTGIAGFIKLLGLDEVITLDKYGPNATILTGELGRIDGIPIVISEWVREVLDSSGLYNATGDKTVIHLIRRNRFAIGMKSRGDVRILRERYADVAQIGVRVRERVDFQPLTDASAERITDLGQNVSTD